MRNWPGVILFLRVISFHYCHVVCSRWSLSPSSVSFLVSPGIALDPYPFIYFAAFVISLLNALLNPSCVFVLHSVFCKINYCDLIAYCITGTMISISRVISTLVEWRNTSLTIAITTRFCPGQLSRGAHWWSNSGLWWFDGRLYCRRRGLLQRLFSLAAIFTVPRWWRRTGGLLPHLRSRPAQLKLGLVSSSLLPGKGQRVRFPISAEQVFVHTFKNGWT